jgi:L-asparaginase II
MKEGAEGVHIAGARGAGVLAFKVIDGSMRAHDVITRAALEKISISVAIPAASVFGGPQPNLQIRAAF